jgi:hypothetical protein
VDDIVAVALVTASGDRRFILTWGRVQANVDPEPLEQLVLRHSSKFGVEATEAQVCFTLQEASTEPYFYECLFAMARKAIPEDRHAWKRDTDLRMQDGYELYYCGAPPAPD